MDAIVLSGIRKSQSHEIECKWILLGYPKRRPAYSFNVAAANEMFFLKLGGYLHPLCFRHTVKSYPLDHLRAVLIA